MGMKKFEYREHTADVAVRVYGNKPEDLFANASCALKHLITDYQPKKTVTRTIFLEGLNLEDLIVSWLNELIFQFYTNGFLTAESKISLSSEGPKTLRACLEGEDMHHTAITIKSEIKAATYHNVKIQKSKNTLYVDIIFDV